MLSMVKIIADIEISQKNILQKGSFFFSSRSRHTRSLRDWSSDVCSSDLRGDVDSAVCTWRDAVRSGRAPGQAWPAWINIPSKIGQVAAVRVLARQRRADDLRRGILIAALSPGLFDTGASRLWLDTTHARTPKEAAAPLLDL